MQQVKVVISGFDHYDDVTVNPSHEVPLALATQGLGVVDIDDVLSEVQVDIHAVDLPVSFAKAWPTLHEVLAEVRPDVVIATGLKHAARGVLLERCATNVMDAVRPDADNARPQREAIRDGGPAAYWTRLPLRSILHDFSGHGIAASLSSDAGTFVCNSLFYHLLDWASVQERVLAGFVSFPMVPESGEQHGLALEQQVSACRDVVGETVRYLLRPSSDDILLA